MTMEDRSSGIERGVPANSAVSTTNILDEITSEASYPLQRTASKRSFDVAFLVAPDENLTRRQNEKLRLQSIDRLNHEIKKDRVRSEIIDVVQVGDNINDRIPQNLTIKHFITENSKSVKADSVSPSTTPYMSPRTVTPTLPSLSPEPEIRRYTSIRLPKSPSPPGAFPLHPQHQTLLGRTEAIDTSLPNTLSACAKIYNGISCSERSQGESRSAFTKVTLTTPRNGYDDVNQTSSPRSSISPDRSSYQSSVSPPVVPPLPAVTSYKYAPTFPPNKMPYPFLVTTENQQTSNILENLKIPQITSPPKVPSPKLSSFRPELPSVYPNLPYNPISAVFPPMAEALARPRFLATAGVAGLLPPSFAALSLPAQNVCAKCNLSFRMTSDLVYHMRSHHKNENTTEAARRRREEKLRCPVCDESFRERHHLTRHMTAHQDKESDAIVDQVEVKRRAATVHGK